MARLGLRRAKGEPGQRGLAPMFALRRRFRFADIELSVKSEGPVSVCQDAVRCNPELPEGMRIDCCSLDSVMIDCREGDQLTVGLALRPANPDEWEMGWNPGEALDAMSFESRAGDVGVIAMRDPDWMQANYGLRFLDADTALTSLQATYEATTSTKPLVQVAVAWTSNASTEQETLSSWFAVDKALKF